MSTYRLGEPRYFVDNHPTPKSKYVADYESFGNNNYLLLRKPNLINYDDYSRHILKGLDAVTSYDYTIAKLAQISEKLADIGSFMKLDDSNTLYKKMQTIKNLPLNHEVKCFVQKLDLDYESLESLEIFLKELRQYLIKEDANYELIDSIYVDPEYHDWQEIKLTIILNKALDYTLKKIKPIIYKMADNMTPSSNDKIIFVFKSKQN